ncbi:hypothetical protein SAMN04488109_4249 [Chryseolinea serpens]|uniref:YD repeat-containing protein n=1 Tax=Chryseolinea serpens TaxID=947013 RepID=A0A1M5TSC2_9BACT|nr:hypothetical protein [Chryseolinea serpens]SHH53677.1 hypothetical protein SAMN04488109_4249 [Chryseolinea serpens]
MKKNRIHQIQEMPGGFARSFSMLFVVAIVLVTSCNKDDAPSPSGSNAACQLVTQTSTVTGRYDVAVTYTYKSVYGISYDEAGNQTEQSYQYDYTYSDGKTSTSTSKISFQYDDKGFVLRRVSQYNGTDRDGKSTFETSNGDFTYTNDRLTKEAYAYTRDGKVTNYATQFEYDDSGKLIKYSNTYNNSSVKIEYNGDVVSKITKTDGVGNTITPFLEYNQKGLLTKSIETDGGYTEEYHYEYTSEGLVAREERYINGKPSSATVYEYDTKENPNAYVYARQKGYPVVPSTRANFTSKRNITRLNYLTSNAAMTGFEPSSSTTYVYDYNAKDFPTSYTSQTLDKTGVQTGTANTTFEYKGCQ